MYSLHLWPDLLAFLLWRYHELSTICHLCHEEGSNVYGNPVTSRDPDLR
jgi:hypothetical protein